MKARALLENIVARKNLREGTVIILNSDSADAQSVLQGVQRPASPKAQPDARADDEQVMGAIRDKFAINRGGKRYHFTVQRDEQGSITGMDVEEK